MSDVLPQVRLPEELLIPQRAIVTEDNTHMPHGPCGPLASIKQEYWQVAQEQWPGRYYHESEPGYFNDDGGNIPWDSSHETDDLWESIDALGLHRLIPDPDVCPVLNPWGPWL